MVSSRKLLIAYNLDHLPLFKKEANCFDAEYQTEGYSNLFNAISNYDYLIPSVNYKLDRKLLLNAAKLKAVSTPSTGTDHIDFDACEKLGIKVFSLKNDIEFLSSITATAELAFSHILNVIRRIPAAFEHVKDGHWDSSKFRGGEIQGKTIGIIGFGRLGSMVAEYAKAFRMSVITCDPYKTIRKEGVRQVTLEKLLSLSDVITLHVHLNDETMGMINRASFTKMRKGVIIINTSRGALIDSEALHDALVDKLVAGAGLDVLENELEGDTGSNLLVEYARRNSNLIITPHIGGVTVESQQKAFSRALEKLIDFEKKLEIH